MFCLVVTRHCIGNAGGGDLRQNDRLPNWNVGGKYNSANECNRELMCVPWKYWSAQWYHEGNGRRRSCTPHTPKGLHTTIEGTTSWLFQNLAIATHQPPK